MTVTRAFDLAFHAPLRLGGGARDEADAARDFPSDTLSAALVVAAADVFGDTVHGRPLADVAREPPWAVSSLLPWVQLGDHRVRFFPRPHGRALGDKASKAHRRVAYLSSDLLDQPAAKPTLSACGTLAATSKQIEGHVWQRRALRPSVTIDRVSAASELFHLEEVVLAASPPDTTPTHGAWLAVRTVNEDDMHLVHVLLGYLADCGIGADRARGMGRFSLLSPAPEPLDEPARPGAVRMLLGYASPDPALLEALDDEGARYTIVRRAGRIQGAHGGLGLPGRDPILLRKPLRLLTPGSVIPDARPVVGRTREVTPTGFTAHDVFRDGRTLTWPLRGSA